MSEVKLIKIRELIKRPIIRLDQAYEFLNKMTDDEITELDKYIYDKLRKNNVIEKFPEWNAAYLSKIIDIQVLYEILKLGEEFKSNENEVS